MTLKDDINTDIANVKAFVQREETVLEQDAQDAYAWLKSELAALEPTVVADLKAAVSAAVTEARAGATGGSILADSLTILARDGLDILYSVKTDVLNAVVGLTAATPTP